MGREGNMPTAVPHGTRSPKKLSMYAPQTKSGASGIALTSMELIGEAIMINLVGLYHVGELLEHALLR
jgi:hypothetical protein